MWWIIIIFVYILGARVFYLYDRSVKEYDDEEATVAVASLWPIVLVAYIIVRVVDIPARWIVKKFFK